MFYGCGYIKSAFLAFLQLSLGWGHKGRSITLGGLFTLSTLVAIPADAAENTLSYREVFSRAAQLWNTHSEEELRSYDYGLHQILEKNPQDPKISFLLSLYYLKLSELHTHSAQNLNYLKKATEWTEQTEDLEPYGALALLGKAQLSYFKGDLLESQQTLEHLNRDQRASVFPLRYFLQATLLAEIPSSQSKVVAFIEDLFTAKIKLTNQSLISLLRPLLHTYPYLQKKLTATHLPQSYQHTSYFLIGELYEGALNHEMRAHKAYLKAYSLGHRSPELFQALGRTYLKLKSPSKALLWFEASEKASPFQTPVLYNEFSFDEALPPKATHHWDKGRAFLAINKVKAAEKEFLTSLRYITAWNDEHAELKLRSLKDIYSEQGELTPLISLIEHVSKNWPRLTEAHHLLGELHSEHHLHKKALLAFQNALLLDEQNPNLHSKIALSWYHIKEYSKALKHLEQALHHNPSATNLYNVACLKARLGKTKDALSYLKKALHLKPSLKELALKDKDLISLRSHQMFQNILGVKVLTTSSKTTPG